MHIGGFYLREIYLRKFQNCKSSKCRSYLCLKELPLNLPAPIKMMFFYCIFIRCKAEHICERSEVAMKVRPQAEPGSKRAKRVSSFPYVIKSSRPKAEQCERAKRVCSPKENPVQAPRP